MIEHPEKCACDECWPLWLFVLETGLEFSILYLVPLVIGLGAVWLWARLAGWAQ